MSLYNDPDLIEVEVQPEPFPAKPRGSNSALNLALVALVLAAGSMALVVSDQFMPAGSSEQVQSLYDPPENLGALIARVQRSTVTVECGDAQGSGWVIDLDGPGEDADQEDIELDREFPTEVITNHHVIEECIDAIRAVTVTSGDQTFDAALYSWDEKNDLALIGIRQSPPALELSKKPRPGWWAMALGTPYGLAGAVSIGNIMNIDGTDVISTAPINAGNSGGPLINSRGEVIGTNTWSAISDGEDFPEDWNVAVGLQALCRELVECSTPYWR